MNILMKTTLILGFILLSTKGIIASPVVKVINNTEGRVKFGVDVDFGGQNDMWVDPGASKTYDSVSLRLNKVKIRYYPADGSSMLSWDHSIPLDQDYAGWGWIYTIKDDSIEYGASTKTITELLGTTKDSTETINYYWPITLTNNSPYVALASWDDGFKVIEPNADATIRSGTIKLFEKEGNPVKLSPTLNRKTLEINGSEVEGFTTKGTGNKTDSDTRNYINNTDNWLVYYSTRDAHLLHAKNSGKNIGESKSGQSVDVRVYTKEIGEAEITDSTSYSQTINADGTITPQ